MLQNRFIQIDDITLHYKIEGKPDANSVIFINSLGTDLRIWDDVVPHFVEHYQVIRYDKRGHGLSDCPPAPYTIRALTNDILGLMDALSIEQAAIVGLSVGGMVAIDAASNFAERVAALILSDTAPQIGSDDSWNKRINTVRKHGIAHIGDDILKRWFTPAFGQSHPAAYHGFLNMLNRLPAEGYAGVCEAIRDADLTQEAKSIDKNVLVLCGADDASTPSDFVQEATSIIPTVHFHAIENAGHLPCVEQPETTAILILDFLKAQQYV